MEMQAMKCVKAGSGQHAVLLLPGALGTIKLRTKTYRVHYYKLMIRFRTDLPTLLDPKTGLNSRGDLTLVAVDLPGFGASCPPERTWPLKYHRRDAKFAVRLMQKIGFETFSIVGWSDGGRHSRRCSVPIEKYKLFPFRHIRPLRGRRLPQCRPQVGGLGRAGQGDQGGRRPAAHLGRL